MIKRFLLYFVLFFITLQGNTQSRVPNLVNFDLVPYHFGFQLGINRMFFSVHTVDDYMKKTYTNGGLTNSLPDLYYDSANLFRVESVPTYGFVIGIIGNLRLHEYFDLRFTPSLTFGERGLVYDISGYRDGKLDPMQSVNKSIQSTYVEFPLWVRFKGERIHNMRPYILAGAKYALDLASNAKKKDVSATTHVFIDNSDLYADLGIGFDFYTVFFKFGTEIRMSYGLFNLLKYDNSIYTDPIVGLRSKILQINFTFE